MKRNVLVLVAYAQRNKVNLRCDDPKAVIVHFSDMSGTWAAGAGAPFPAHPGDMALTDGVYVLHSSPAHQIYCKQVSGDVVTSGETPWPKPPSDYSSPQSQTPWPKPPTQQQVADFRTALEKYVSSLR